MRRSPLAACPWVTVTRHLPPDASSTPPLVTHGVAAAPDYEGVGFVNHGGVLARVVELVEEEAEGVDAGALLVVGLDGDPWRIIRVRAQERLLLRFGVLIPSVQ